MRRPLNQETGWLLGLLTLAGLVLWLTAIDEVFTLDECHYFASVRALASGGLTVPETEGLPPSRELIGFDPTGRYRVVASTPVAPSVPPLYAPLALPFAPFGWRGFILLNTLAFVATTGLVFSLAKRHARASSTPWLAAATYALGGFCLAYAQGMWPHMLTVAWATAGVWLADRARLSGEALAALGAGLAVGVATGIRYQNLVFGLALLATLLLFSPRRVRTSAVYAAGMGGPLLACSLINHARLGSFNPVSKGRHYLPLGLGDGADTASLLADKLLTLWVRVVDYSAHPPFTAGLGQALPKDPHTGAFLVVGGLKKALLQSAPWIALALVALTLAWSQRGARRLDLDAARRHTLQSLSVPVVAVLALFSWTGLGRHDGWSFNQRYLLELVPLFAVALALAVDRKRLDPQPLVLGGAVGLALAAVPVLATIPEHWFRQRAIMIVPICLAGVTAAVWSAPARVARLEPVRLGLLAAGVGWAFALHLGDDMVAERGLRDFNGFQRAAIEAHLPAAPSALIAIAPQREAMCPLQRHHDLVMIDPSIDDAADTDRLTAALLAGGRRVFVVGGRVPDAYLEAVFRDRRVRMIAAAPIPFGEVLGAPPLPTGARPSGAAPR